ncbi:FecCD family ABC transporter permease [Kineococcus sp. SYSU DK006]|uniref:FecCD family ABC transporter permease n=1 Tax=Kineococcus sp. SYSU DK006 TaxID=3383127 RepID=UPI003D7E7297
MRATDPPTDPLGLRARTRRHTAVLLALGAAALLSALVAIAAGAVAVPPGTVLRILLHALGGAPGAGSWAPEQEAIVWTVRTPRVLLGCAVGAGLAVCGAALQAVVRNVLADPYVLGIDSGASCGAAAALLFGALAGAGEHALPLSAFAGALAATVAVFAVARAGGRLTSLRLLLAGVAVGYALSAATSFLVFASDSAEGARSVVFWLLGSLGLARWGPALAVVLVVVAATLALLLLWAPRLDALAVGDETARALGVSPSGLRTRLLVVVAACVGVVVAASGSIGFVGLVVPHLARRLVGAAHRWVLPACALLGAVLLTWSDLVARVLLQPQELPIGIVTALVGAPFLLHLVRSAP